MKELFIIAEQKNGKNFKSLIEPRPVCPDCPEAAFQGVPMSGPLKKIFIEASMTLQVSCGKCGKKLAEFPVTVAGE